MIRYVTFPRICIRRKWTYIISFGRLLGESLESFIFKPVLFNIAIIFLTYHQAGEKRELHASNINKDEHVYALTIVKTLNTDFNVLHWHATMAVAQRRDARHRQTHERVPLTVGQSLSSYRYSGDTLKRRARDLEWNRCSYWARCCTWFDFLPPIAEPREIVTWLNIWKFRIKSGYVFL